MSFRSAYNFGSRVRLSGDSEAITPILDAWTQTAPGWLGPAAFVALFAFVFAIGLGTIWEIFEFGMDSLFGTNMMKSGLKDTMCDLIVNCIGALTISVLGWGYLRTEGYDSFLERWVHKFIERNPHLFERRKSSR